MNDSHELNKNIQQAVLKYSSTIIRIAFTYVKNISDAEDIAQDVFLTCLQKNPVFESAEHEKAWLIRIALPDDLSYLPKEEGEILQAVLQLEQKYRLPIHLYYYEGHSIKEIAEILHINSSTIGTRLARGRSLLKDKIGGF